MVRTIQEQRAGNARKSPQLRIAFTRSFTQKPPKHLHRAQVTNGKTLLPGVDGRSIWARRFRDVVHLYASDQGGEDNLSEGRRSIIRRIACLQVELELLETRFALAGGAEADDLDLYQRTAGNLRRLLEGLGLDRVPRDITPSLQEYIKSKAAEAP